LRSDFARMRREQQKLTGRGEPRKLRQRRAAAADEPGGNGAAVAAATLAAEKPGATLRPGGDKSTKEAPQVDPAEVAENSPKDIFSVYLESLQQRIAAIDRQTEELDRMLKQEQQKAKDLIQLEVSDSTLRQTIDRKRQLFDIVLKRLEELNLSEDMGGYKATVVSAPGQGYQVEPDLARSLAVALVLGLMSGFGLAYLVDMADKRFRSPEDVQRHLNLPLLGHIPLALQKDLIAKKGSRVDVAVCVHHKPSSSLAETFRTVRTGLFFSAAGKNAKIIQITSPAPRDGKTTVASNLAVAIAQSGKRVVLLDADCRKPRVHKLFGIDRQPGLKEIIRGNAPARDVWQTCEVDNLMLIPAGERSRNPAELLASPRFGELLQELRNDPEVDCVIVDTPPLLAVSDAVSVASHVDGVLLVIRVHSKWSRDMASRASEILQTVGAKPLGVVVNAVGTHKQYGYAHRYSSRYGGYKYNYRYNYYGYRYTPYGYGYGDPNYAEGEEEENAKSPSGNGQMARSDASEPARPDESHSS